MWCRFGVTMTAVTLGLVSSCVSCETALAAQPYTTGEFVAVLKGFGYAAGNTLSDATSKKGIREFQQDYKLSVDGIAGKQTENFAAQLVQIFHANLNLVVKPKPLLPRSRFYTAQTTAVVKQFQQQSGLAQTGVADFPLRLRLDNQAKRILKIPITTPAPTAPSTSTSPSPSMSPSSEPSTSPSPAPSTSP